MDSEGEFTKASLEGLTDFPDNFTICGDYMVEGWLAGSVKAKMFTFASGYGSRIRGHGYVDMEVTPKNTKFLVCAVACFTTILEHVWFPFSWLHLCLSRESGTGNMALVVNGQVLEEGVYEKAKPTFAEKGYPQRYGFRME